MRATPHSSMGKGVVLSYLAVEVTEAQLLITGLTSGIAVVGLLVRWLVTSPVREAEAYNKGRLDEENRCQEDIKELRTQMGVVLDENMKFRNALFRLVIASDLTPEQRTDIAMSLGFSDISKLITDQRAVEGVDDTDTTGN